MSDAHEKERGLRQIHEATDGFMFGLLQREGWFRASEIMDETGIDRGVVRTRARALVDLGLLDQREVVGAPKQTFEWRPNPVGKRIVHVIDEWLGEAGDIRPETPAYIGLFAVTSYDPLGGDLTDELVDRLKRSSVAQLVPAVVFEEQR